MARASAEDAGIDHTTAYARRRTHSDFAAAWAEALRAHRERVKAEEAAEIAAFRRGTPSPTRAFHGPLARGASMPAPPGSPAASPTSSGGRDEVAISGGQVRRVGHGRWSKEKEAIFFDELAATANAAMAAKAAGVSTNAVLARRLKHPVFRAKWEAVVRTAKASIDLYLVEEAKKTFELGQLDTGDVKPRVTIDQAIKISQLAAAKSRTEAGDPFAEQAASMSDDALEELRERLVKKFVRLMERARREKIAEGWSYDEEHDHIVPPGWVRAGSTEERRA